MERDDLVFKAKLAEQAERYVFCALLRVARWFLRVDFERRFWFRVFIFFFSFTERDKKSTRVTTFHPMMRRVSVCLILFLRVKEGNANGTRRARVQFRARELVFRVSKPRSRAFFFRKRRLCVLARVRRGNIETTRWWWERCLSKRPKSERKESFFFFLPKRRWIKATCEPTQNLLSRVSRGMIHFLFLSLFSLSLLVCLKHERLTHFLSLSLSLSLFLSLEIF